ncbi:unnamed protein product [Rotaria magnacalcarata]
MDPRQWNCVQVSKWLSSFSTNQQVINTFIKPHCTFRKLFKHIQYIHLGEPNFKIRCELGITCGTTYSSFSGYKAHIYREHTTLLNVEPRKQEVQSYTDAANDETLDDICVDFDMERNHETEEELKFFERFYIRFLLQLREGHSLPPNIIQSITCGMLSLIEFIHDLIKKEIKPLLDESSRTTVASPSNDVILLTDVNHIFSIIGEKMVKATNGEYNFLKLCQKYYSYEPPKPIQLEGQSDVAFYIPIKSSIQQMLKKPDVTEMLLKNLNRINNHHAADPDLMFNYRHGSESKQHPVLSHNLDSLLINLYTDDIGLTNPLGAKKDEQKITMVYFQLEDLPDTVRSTLKSIGLVAMCHSEYLSIPENKKKFFEIIIEDLNNLQTNGLLIPTLNRQFNFAFSVLSGDHLANNFMGGFQKNFNSGQCCRICHFSYDEKLIPLTDITFTQCSIDEHDRLVQQVLMLNNGIIIQGVSDISPLSKLLGFHAVKSLPNGPMHDFNEGLCGPVIFSMLKEASNKRILTYGEVEERLINFEYGSNDKSNKPPIIKKKHLSKGKIIGTASQKMCLFRLFPIIFHDIFDQLDTKDIYTCLREIISIVFACPLRKSWISYLDSLTIRFQCLMVHIIPNLVTPKIHFITDYAKQIAMNGPPIRHWCMRFESKHRYFKQLATKSNNFKNIIFSLSKRHQLHQCFLFSSWNYFQANEQFSSPKQVKLKGLSAAVRQLLHDNIEDFDYATHISECQQQAHDHVKIMKGSVFVDTISHEEEVPSFMQLAFIFKINNKWVLIVEQLQTIAFVETLWSFELERTRILLIKKPNDLILISPKGYDIYQVKKKSYVNILSRLTKK